MNFCRIIHRGFISHEKNVVLNFWYVSEQANERTNSGLVGLIVNHFYLSNSVFSSSFSLVFNFFVLNFTFLMYVQLSVDVVCSFILFLSLDFQLLFISKEVKKSCCCCLLYLSFVTNAKDRLEYSGQRVFRRSTVERIRSCVFLCVNVCMCVVRECRCGTRSHGHTYKHMWFSVLCVCMSVSLWHMKISKIPTGVKKIVKFIVCAIAAFATAVFLLLLLPRLLQSVNISSAKNRFFAKKKKQRNWIVMTKKN